MGHFSWEKWVNFQRELTPDSLLGRISEREVVLTRPLRAKLIELNPGLPEEVYDNAVRQIVSITAMQSLTVTNREKNSLLRNGVQITYRDNQGKRKRQRLQIFDFNDPTKNEFLCVRELWIQGDLYRRRADIIGFVNGIPLLFIECKNIHRNLETAYKKNYSDYRDTIPEIFHHNAIIMFGNGNKAKIGTITSEWGHFQEWKRLSEEEPGVVDMETVLKGICNKKNFLDIVENFIIFDDSTGETRKILAHNHQFLGVNRSIEAVKDRKNRNGKLGVFWHTQGAGKSYSMVFFTRKIRRKLTGNFTFLILTDRDDLDTQIYKTFAGCDLVDNDRDPCRASNGRHLRRLLKQNKLYIFSLIQKFNQEVDPDKGYTKRSDIIVITDEAHRTQYGTLALNMRNALPNASYIGFTGTPLFKDDQITMRVFGDYVSTYDFQRAVEDNSTVPLYYDARGEKLGVATNDLNERIAEKLEELQMEDANVSQRLEKELKRDYHIITAGKRLDQVAKDFVEHYSNAWESGKAIIICIDKITCVRMYDLIVDYWEKQIKKLKKEIQASTDMQESIYKKRQLKWMNQTRTAVVISEEQGEVEKFRKWNLDIKKHRRLIKRGIELPETMRRQPQFHNLQRLELDDAFKVEEHPFRIAIVCAMWLTGFDVPCLSTLYLDKPLKAHTLMQAIARANRVNEGKNNGMIVDYCGILKNLRKALATFAGTNDDGRGGPGGGIEPAKPEEELLEDLAESINLVRDFLSKHNVTLVEIFKNTGFKRNAAIITAMEAVNENDETRKRFMVMCRAVFKKFKACINVKGVNKYRRDYEAIKIIYNSLQGQVENADISDIIHQLHQVVDEVIETKPKSINEDTKTYDISKINFDVLRQEFQRSQTKRTTVQNLKQAIENRLQRLMEQNPLRTDFQQHYEEIVAAYNREKDRATIEETFEALLKFVEEMDEEESRAAREGLDEESLAVFDLLKKPNLTPEEIKRIKNISVELLKTLKAKKLRVDQWKEKEATRDAVHVAIHNFLWSDKTGLPADQYSENDVKFRIEEVFRHVFRVYPTVPSPYYQTQEAA